MMIIIAGHEPVEDNHRDDYVTALAHHVGFSPHRSRAGPFEIHRFRRDGAVGAPHDPRRMDVGRYNATDGGPIF